MKAVFGARLLCLALLLSTGAQAEVRLPKVFGSHMVLQHDKPLTIWGWADPNEPVTVKLADQPAATATAGADGAWRVVLPPQKAGGPCMLTVRGTNEIILDDVLIGEVWVCSGQSNMEWRVASSLNFEQEKAAAAQFPRIRQLAVAKKPAPQAQPDVLGDWTVCSPDTVGSFTAAGYFMARDLINQLDVPIGLINTSWGGTRIEPWTPPIGFEGIDTLAAIRRQVTLADPKSAEHKELLAKQVQLTESWVAQARDALAKELLLPAPPAYPTELLPLTDTAQPQQVPTTLYNGMVHGTVPFAIRGAIWYQGESNHREGLLYADKMRALIEGWRKVWGQGEFPFYYVQIAPYHYGNEPSYLLPQFWEAQAAALKVPNTGMVVTNDIAEINDIHPKNKQEVGRRLALLALAGTYGQQVVASGPVFKAMAVEGNRVRVTFDRVGGGLTTRDGTPLDWFELGGEAVDYVAAQAVIEGSSVVVSAPGISQPTAVRFGWHRNAEPTLMNKEGLPARPFSAGSLPGREQLAAIAPESRDFALLYDLDLAKLGADVTYDVDNRDKLAGPIDRIAYFLELQKADQPAQHVFVSMDAFTSDLAKIGLPTLASGASWQLRVSNMNVVSNAPGIETGMGLPGNLEFWPHNYGPMNAVYVPNASTELWDFGDQRSDPADGYGSMQIHNYAARQTIFAINNWKAGRNANIGIGNSSGDERTRDWTFVANASTYTIKRLRVLVHTKR